MTAYLKGVFHSGKRFADYMFGHRIRKNSDTVDSTGTESITFTLVVAIVTEIDVYIGKTIRFLPKTILVELN